MALAERRDCKDYISIFVCDDWHLLRVSLKMLSFNSFYFYIYDLMFKKHKEKNKQR